MWNDGASLTSLALVPLLGVAAWLDVRQRRVPNWVSGSIALLGLVWQGVAMGPWAAVVALGCGVTVVVLLWLPWSAGGVGGGDVKLAAACSMVLGWSDFAWFVLTTAALGGLVAGWSYLGSRSEVRGAIRERVMAALVFRSWPSVPGTATGRVSVPYAVAIAAACAWWWFEPWGSR